MVTVVMLLDNYHNVISYYNHILDMTKTLVQLALKTSPATVAPNGITVYMNLPSSVLKVVRNEEASSSCWCQNPFFTMTNSHYACICKQMSNVLMNFKMVWFPHDSFVQAGWVQANPKLQIT